MNGLLILLGFLSLLHLSQHVCLACLGFGALFGTAIAFWTTYYYIQESREQANYWFAQSRLWLKECLRLQDRIGKLRNNRDKDDDGEAWKHAED